MSVRPSLQRVNMRVDVDDFLAPADGLRERVQKARSRAIVRLEQTDIDQVLGLGIVTRDLHQLFALVPIHAGVAHVESEEAAPSAADARYRGAHRGEVAVRLPAMAKIAIQFPQGFRHASRRHPRASRQPFDDSAAGFGAAAMPTDAVGDGDDPRAAGNVDLRRRLGAAAKKFAAREHGIFIHATHPAGMAQPRAAHGVVAGGMLVR
jgi:hypothetical protein